MKSRHAVGALLVLMLVLAGRAPASGQGTILYNGFDGGVYAIRPHSRGPELIAEGYRSRVTADGRLVAIWRVEEADNQTIHILDMRTFRQVTSIRLDPPGTTDFQWSPDAQWLAYNGEWRDVYLIRMDSGAIHRLTSVEDSARRIVWAPDSRSLFFGKTNASRADFWEARIDGKGKPKLREFFHEGAGFFGVAGSFFTFSPSGDRIAYCCGGGVYVANSDGTGHRKVTPDGLRLVVHVDWAPDESQLVFSAEIDGVYGLHTISLDTGEMRALVETGRSLPMWPAWRSGDVLAVSSTDLLGTTWGELKR